MTDQAEPKPKRKRNYPKNRQHYEDLVYADRKKVSRVIELVAVDTPAELIATATGCTTNEVNSIRSQYANVFKLVEDLPRLRAMKSQIIEGTVIKLLNSINDQSKIDASTIQDLGRVFEILFKAHRLEEDKSTSNQAVHSLSFTGNGKSLDDIE